MGKVFHFEAAVMFRLLSGKETQVCPVFCDGKMEQDSLCSRFAAGLSFNMPGQGERNVVQI